MFRESTTQSSMFEVNNYFPDALPEQDWCYTYRDRVLPLIDEEKFRHLYCESEGRPNASIRTMVSLLIFMGLEQYLAGYRISICLTVRLDHRYQYTIRTSPNCNPFGEGGLWFGFFGFFKVS